MLRKWGTIVLFLLATPILALAQNTGKLAGVVTDASTGEPLPGANVVIEGTQLGTATDVDGSYFILGVPAGVYDIQASFVGYGVVTVSDVEVNAGYTREQDFTLAPGAELDEIVVEYERPLIQRDALGVPKITSAEQIANLPVRGVANVASLSAGVVKEEGSDDLFVRGGREEEVTYYVDGVKVIGGSGIAVPDQAVQEQEMLVGAIPAKYGDAMSGIISVTTKSGAPSLFGSIEAITSEVLDSYGYNDVQATLGGPIIGEKLQFFLSGEYGNFADSNPRAVEFPTLSSADRELVQNTPQSVRIVNNAGESEYILFPSDIAPGTPAADVLARLGEQVPEGWRLSNEFPSPLYTANTFTRDQFEYQNERPGADSRNIIVNGNLQFSPVQSIRLRAGGGFEQTRGKEFNFQRSLYAPESFRNDDRDTWRLFGSWTQYLSNNTFFQLEANFSDYQSVQYHQGFSSDPEDLLFYGDFDHPVNAPLQRFFEFNSEDSTYVYSYSDGETLGTGDIQNTWAPYGALPVNGFTQRHYNRLGFRANATTQIGIHQIEFGGEFEKQTQRLFNMIATGTENLAKYYEDGNAELAANAVSTYEELDFGVMNNDIFYYGYNYLGTEEVDDASVANFTDPDYDGADKFNVAPYEPIYYAGYVQDKIEYRDLVLNVGVRVDVFDNNTLALRDPFALYPIVRAGDRGDAPSNIADDFAVYLNTSGNVIGYRDLEGNFFDAQGQNATGDAIRSAGGRPQATVSRVTEEVFEDYDPQVTFQPRIGLSFPVTDQALFFASYNVISQRPSENQFDTIQQWNQAAQRSKLMNNPGLRPQTTTTYELGFRQRVGARAALQISGFYKQIENLISRRIVQNVFPGNYQTYENVDFGTVKGVEFEFDLRRTNNVALNANYTLSFAQGTGSDAQTTAQIVWRMEEDPFYPRFISPLDFDQRHRANISLDYRLGENEGPELFGGYPLSNFGFNAVGTFGSGLPYTRRRDETPIYTSFNGFLLGEINGQNMPFSSLVNLRVDRRFSLGGSNLVVYLWVQNLFNQDNVTDVYPQTGLAFDDAYLTNPEGRDYVASLEENNGAGVAQSFTDHYRAKLRDPLNYGMPRTTRLGVRLDF